MGKRVEKSQFFTRIYVSPRTDANDLDALQHTLLGCNCKFV